MTNIGIQAPWVIFYKEVAALFEHDPDVRVEANGECTHIKLYVEKHNKAEALAMIMPTERVFGNITVTLEVIPPNSDEMSFQEVFETAFANNPCFAFARTTEVRGGAHVDHAMFKPIATQFYADDMFDLYGNYTMLYQDVAKDVLKDYDPDLKIGSSLLIEEE